ncbi:hypothetical protein A3D85_03570 [Candidatus Amesbacteria bacterium RIFCSPHIGHO2_02_FULL_47_9]|nr:MAG: hypothetical protein A3D85_03570 [Candidatus Amesbacteria bacterium RIFCSPHIGHO2_02_FULL_47_9]
MKKYSLKCICGHVLTVDAAGRDEAVVMVKQMMGREDTMKDHFAKYHKSGEPLPSREQMMAMIDLGVVEGVLGGAKM